MRNAHVRYNAHRAALEQRKWDEALAALQEAAALDPKRFTLFPLDRYPPQRILGAGGFGLKDDAPTVLKTNYATAQLLAGNLTGCVVTLGQVRDEGHPAVRRLRSALKEASAAFNCPMSRGGTSTALTPSSTVSGMPPTAVATMARSAAIASNNTSGDPSVWEGSTKTSAMK